MIDIPTHEDPDRKKIVRLYGWFAASIILTLIPHVLAAAASIILLTYVLGTAYVLRNGSAKDSLLTNHMTFIIRTIWITGLFAIFTTVAASAYLLERIDNAALMPCIEKFLNINPDHMAMVKIAELSALFGPCMDAFVRLNFTPLVLSMLIAGGPLLLYALVRFSRGLSRAAKGYRIAKPKAWF